MASCKGDVYPSLIHWRHLILKDHFVYAPSQWGTALQCTVVSHWLGAYTNWSLILALSHLHIPSVLTCGSAAPHVQTRVSVTSPVWPAAGPPSAGWGPRSGSWSSQPPQSVPWLSDALRSCSTPQDGPHWPSCPSGSHRTCAGWPPPAQGRHQPPHRGLQPPYHWSTAPIHQLHGPVGRPVKEGIGLAEISQPQNEINILVKYHPKMKQISSDIKYLYIYILQIFLHFFYGCSVEDWEWIKKFHPSLYNGCNYISMLGFRSSIYYLAWLLEFIAALVAHFQQHLVLILNLLVTDRDGELIRQIALGGCQAGIYLLDVRSGHKSLAVIDLDLPPVLVGGVEQREAVALLHGDLAGRLLLVVVDGHHTFLANVIHDRSLLLLENTSVKCKWTHWSMWNLNAVLDGQCMKRSAMTRSLTKLDAYVFHYKFKWLTAILR